MFIPKDMIRLWINMETVAVVRPESRGEAELNVPGVTEHGHDVGQGQLQLLLTDGGILRPGEVTHEAPSVHRLWLSQVKISRKEISDKMAEQLTSLRPK